MTTDSTSSSLFILWGTPHSLYTGKVRSYLIKKGLPFREICPSHPDFGSRIQPAVKSFVVPVLETPDGRILQDTADILDFVEGRFPEPRMDVDSPVQRTVSLLLDAFASEGLLAAAMHYRWSYRSGQERFLEAEFGRSIHRGPDRPERLAAGRTFMEYFHGFLPGLGVDAGTIPAIEAAYTEMLDALDLHFQAHPYLLGGRPCRGDFGLMAPLYAHLSRDPVPSALMKAVAPNVYRWTERMNLAQIAEGEFADRPEAYLEDDAIAETLEPVLRLAFADWGAALAADARCFDNWVQSNPSLPAGHPVSADGSRRIHPSVGAVEYLWRGALVRRQSAPHGLWLFDRVVRHARSLAGADRARLDALLERTGGHEMMAIECARRMVREDYQLVLG